MASIGRKLETKGVIAMTLLTLVLMNIGCEDKIDNPVVNPSEGKTVEVTLNIGFADEEAGTGANASPVSKTGNGSNSLPAFEVVPVADVPTKAVSNVPDKLYNLDIIQYTAGGAIVSNTIASQTIGADFSASVNLTPDTGSKLLLVARGNSSDFGALSGKSLSAVQAMTVKAENSKINATSTDATGSGLANMPYYLLLENVTITSAGKIHSTQGNDARLLLKRLAVKMQLDWSISSSMKTAGYVLKEVKLCQAPAHYRLLPETEKTDKWGDVYPTSVAEFADVYRLTGTGIENGTTQTKTVWIPANARGISSYATSPLYRNKNNANPAATYAEFVVDNKSKKERLYYRAYLGGNETNDFNLLENKNYHWTVNINNANYTNDPRIQLLDQTPVISTNLQPTANCFMMRPGTNICFNPYKHEAGTNGWNTALTNGATINSDKEITSVKVLWQAKDAGTSGDLVMGYVIDNTNHTNLVNYTNLNNLSTALVHVKVPVTNGGNAVIAAYNASGVIVWSWHLWISDYVPALLNTAIITNDQTRSAAILAAQNATRGGAVQTYIGTTWTQSGGKFYRKIIMDRNLGALHNTYSLTSRLDAARTYGNLYQWGRKDPLPGSVDGSVREIDILFDSEGITFTMNKESNGTLAKTIQNPNTFYKELYLANDSWGPDTKSIYDPCPAGWRVPDFTATDNMFEGLTGGESGNLKYLIAEKWYNNYLSDDQITEDKFSVSNGYLYNGSVWFPAFRLREAMTGSLRDQYTSGAGFQKGYLPSYSTFGARATQYTNYVWACELKMNNFSKTPLEKTFIKPYGFSVRCIQDK